MIAASTGPFPLAAASNFSPEMFNPKLDKVYEEVLKLADKKKDINDDDILVLAGANRTQNHRIKLEYLQVTSGVGVRSVASLGLNISGCEV